MAINSFSDIIDNITPEMHKELRETVQLGRFPDGRRLTREQSEDLLRALLAWEQKNLPEDERTGAMTRQSSKKKMQVATTNAMRQS